MKKVTYILFTFFLTFQAFGQPIEAFGIQIIRDQAESLALNNQDLKEMQISSSFISDGRKYIYIQQQYEGLEIENAIMSLVLNDRNEIVSSQHSLIKDVHQKVLNFGGQVIASEKAFNYAASHLGLSPKKSFLKSNHLRSQQNPNLKIYSKGIASKQEIPVHLKWILKDNHLIKVYKVGIYKLEGDHYWELAVDAQSGEILHKNDQIIHCSFDHPNDLSFSKQEAVYTIRKSRIKLNNIGFDNDEGSETYNVYPLFVADPSKGERIIIENPADPLASPYGWHDIDGLPGADFIDTRGNNVYAQEDYNYNNSGGKRANGGDNLNFNFEIDFNQGPKSYVDASLTNLFYWVNLNHDIFYHYGFDEASGNFQYSNFGRGGMESDQVYADAQDGSGQNNAQFLALEDGNPGRMEMFIWGNARAVLSIPGDSKAAGEWKGAESGLQGGLNSISRRGPQTGLLVQVIDDQNTTSEGCSTNPISNPESLEGNIALIDRGNCLFSEKIINAQVAGAVACVVCNNVSPGTFTMGGTNNQIEIPAMMLSSSDCDKIKRVLKSGISLEATVKSSGLADNLDSALDNVIITHEYGHGISIRLTGGRNNANCLNNNEQMGEGWSDYFGLMLTTDWLQAKPEDRRPVGNWLLQQDDKANGIRPYPYSYTKSINPMTYGDIKRFSIPHGLGAVWCSMLWDMTWEIIKQEGKVSDDIYQGNGGNNIALKLVIEGLKLQNCIPGFLDGRDAILQADKLLYDGIHHYAIWKAFARRGLGFRADQGSAFSVSDGKSSNELPAAFISKAISFAAKDSVSSILLSWESIREIENKAFRILRSEDNKIYKEIFSMPGLEFSFESRFLNYEDRNVVPGKWYYYKLESQDFSFRTNAQGLDSAIIVLTDNLTIFPNPSSGLMNLVVSRKVSDPVYFELFNTQGQIIKRWDFEDPQVLHSTLTLDITDQPKGTYFIRMTSKSENQIRKVVIK